jgi:regulator of sigma E protease
MTLARILVAILGLVVLMIVHEGGHFLAARRFGMRVTRFSIGFGPTLWKYKPKDSPTVYQVGVIPFLAYVYIAGMNPFEESDPKDKGSYANASLWARIVTIAAGPLTNYFFASVLIFFGLLVGGKEVSDETSMRVSVVSGGPAQVAGVQTNDKIDEVNGAPVKSWDELKGAIKVHAGESVELTIERGGEVLHKTVVPKGDKDEGRIQVQPVTRMQPVGAREAAKLSLVEPPFIVYETVRVLGRMVTLQEKPELHALPDIVDEGANRVKMGPGPLLLFLGIISANLAAFNLLPFPALDGGRLLFLGAEAVSRRKPDAKLEAHVHAVGLIVLLTLMVFVTYSNMMSKLDRDPAKATPAASSPK